MDREEDRMEGLEMTTGNSNRYLIFNHASIYMDPFNYLSLFYRLRRDEATLLMTP
jgi:hypothetical protein